MQTNRLASASAPAGGLGQRWNRFWFAPIDSMLLHRMRVLVGLLIVVWLLTFAGHHHALFGLSGWLDKEGYEEIDRKDTANKEANPDEPTIAPAPIGWSIFYLADADAAFFDALYWIALAIVVFFTLGFAPRVTGVLTWVVVVSVIANPAITYDADYLLAILAFYLMIAYLLHGIWSGPRRPVELIFGAWDACVLSWWSKREDDTIAPRSYAANLVLRLVQIHFAIIVVASALAALQMMEWWTGIAYWSFSHPPFKTTRESYERELGSAVTALTFMSLVQYAALAWQFTFPAFAWRRGRWRVLLIGGGALAWVGFFWLRDLPLFGPIYFIGCLSFLHADEWAALGKRLGFRRGTMEAKAARVAPAMQRVKVGTN